MRREREQWWALFDADSSRNGSQHDNCSWTDGMRMHGLQPLVRCRAQWAEWQKCLPQRKIEAERGVIHK